MLPALPLGQGGLYVAGAFIVFVALILVYVAIIGAKIARIERELGELSEVHPQGSIITHEQAERS